MTSDVAIESAENKVSLPLPQNDVSHEWRLRTVITLLLSLALLPPILQNRSIYPMVFRGGDDIRLLGNDAWFHLRHADYAAKNFPRLRREDPQQLYGQTVRSDACSLFDLGIALAARVLAGGQYNPMVVAVVAAWTPVILGVMCTIVLYWLVRMFAGQKLSLLAVVMFQTYPGSALPRMAVGVADHHVAEILLVLLTLIGLMAGVKAWGDPGSRYRVPGAILIVLPIVVFLFTWIGAPLYLGIIGLTFGVMIILSILQSADTWPLAVISFRFGVTTLMCSVLVGYLWPDGIIHQGAYRCALQACGAIAVVPAAVHGIVRILQRLRFSASSTAQIVLITVIVALLAAAAAIPDVSQALTVFYRKSGIVAEQAHAARIADWYLQTYGLPGLLCCAALPLVLQRFMQAQEYHERDRAVLSLAIAGSLIWLISRWVADYEYVVAVIVPILAVVTLRELGPLFTGKKYPRWFYASVLAALLLPIFPFGLCAAPMLSQDSLKHSVICHDGWRQAMTWMNTQTPNWRDANAASDASPDVRDAGGKLDYGVLCGWEYGNLISVLADRTPVWSRFPNKQLSRWLFETSEESTDKLLTDLCGAAEDIRYVVLDDRTLSAYLPGHTATAELKRPEEYLPTVRENEESSEIAPAEAFEATMAHQLYFRDGANIGRYRLVFESSDQAVPVMIAEKGQITLASFRDDYVSVMEKLPAGTSVSARGALIRSQGVHSSVKIFERVRGASIVGRGPSGWNVSIRLELESGSTNRHFDYHASTLIDEQGRFQIVVPHPTVETAHTDITPLGDYSVTLSRPSPEELLSAEPTAEATSEPATAEAGTVESSAEVIRKELTCRITEADVRQGNAIDLGSLANQTSSSTLVKLTQ